MIPSYSARPRIFPTLFSPLALYRFTAANDFSDSSGNSRTLTATGSPATPTVYAPGVSAQKGAILNPGETIASRTDSALCLAGAMSIWSLVWVNHFTAVAGCSIARCGNAIGGVGTRVNWSLDLTQSSSFPVIQYFHQAGSDQVALSTRLVKGWSVLGFTRNTAGTVVKFYANGLNIATSGTLTAPTLSSSAITSIGGIPVLIGGFGKGPFARPIDQVGIYGSELTAAQMMYIARYVLGAMG